MNIIFKLKFTNILNCYNFVIMNNRIWLDLVVICVTLFNSCLSSGKIMKMRAFGIITEHLQGQLAIGVLINFAKSIFSKVSDWRLKWKIIGQFFLIIALQKNSIISIFIIHEPLFNLVLQEVCRFLFYIYWGRMGTTPQKIKLSIKDTFSKCDQICSVSVNSTNSCTCQNYSR